MSLVEQSQEHYAKGVPFEIAVPNYSLADMLARTAGFYPGRVAIDFFGERTTFAQLHIQVRQAAQLLRAAGLQSGDRVALIMPNCPQHVVAFFAALSLGAIVAEHNPLAPPAQLKEQLAHHGGKFVIAWSNVLATLNLEEKYGDYTLFSVDLTQALPASMQLLLRLPLPQIAAKRSALYQRPCPQARKWDKEVARQIAPPTSDFPPVSPTAVAVLLHTGGTTGTPKAVTLTHRNLLANVMQGQAWVPVLQPGAETFYAILPFFHAFGLTLNLLYATSVGATQVLFPKFDEALVRRALRRRRPTFVPGVPPVFDKMLKIAAEHKISLRSVRIAFSGAMSLDSDLAARWEEATGGLIIEGYGMTETAPVSFGSPVSAERRPSSLGLAFPSTEFRIVDPEDVSKDVAPGEPGELLVRGPQVMQGYYNNPEETAEVLLPDGYLRTGDIVRLDEGFLIMADRRKELIISSGFNVYPSQVEAAVRKIPGVVDVAVVGLPQHVRGEEIVAAVVLEDGAELDLATLREWAKDSLAHYALPRQLVVLSELPRSQIGKVLRRNVREQVLSLTSKSAEGLKALSETVSEATSAALSSLREMPALFSKENEDGTSETTGTKTESTKTETTDPKNSKNS